MSTVNTAVETLSTVAQNFVEKNRTKAKLNRLRMVMKNESELMNRAYIALGKEYYQILKKGDAEPTEKQEKLLEVIDSCKAKIARARDCYRTIVESQNEYIYATPANNKETVSTTDVIDITVACSNESDYKTSPFSDAKEAVKEKAEDIKETVAEKKEDVAEKAENIKEAAVEISEDIKDAAADTKKVVAENVKETKEKVSKTVKKALDEECPEDELF
jgi:hypothetical protein